MFPEEDEENDALFFQELENNSVSLVIQWWIKKRLRASEDIQDLRQFVLKHYPHSNDFIKIQKSVIPFILNALPLEQQKKLDYCVDFVKNNHDLNDPDVIRCIRTRDRIFRKILKMFKQLVKDIYEMTTVECNPIQTSEWSTMTALAFNPIIPIKPIEEYEPHDSEHVHDPELDPLTISFVNIDLDRKPDPEPEPEPIMEPTITSESPPLQESTPVKEPTTTSITTFQEPIIQEEESKPVKSTTIVQESSIQESNPVKDQMNDSFCSVCLDTFNEDWDDVSFCHYSNHPIHIICRVALANRQIHTCPTCRQLFESDGGISFCMLYGLNYKKRGERVRRSAPLSASKIDTPINHSNSSSSSSSLSSSISDRQTRSSAGEYRDQIEYRNTRDRMIYLLQNRRIPLDVLQECLFKIQPYTD